MKFWYRLGLKALDLFLPVLALSGEKMKKFSEGRKGIFMRISKFRNDNPGDLAWFHVASLGEYEQAKPVIHELKKRNPKLLIAVSFFSPSGYEPTSSKPQENVDFITYLPLDLKSNAENFVSLLNPSFSVFVKYDIWYEHIMALKERGIPVFLISALFRPTQRYFKGDGFFQNLLKQFDHIFTQDESSISLLDKIHYSNHTLAGDTRFDRVAENAKNPKPFPQLKTWIGQKQTIVLGSVWEEDMKILIPLINANPEFKWIIAPHDLDQGKMREWIKRISLRSAFYSKAGWNDSPNVLFLDTIGMLSSVYQFAKIAYVGGAFGSGLHNILEPLGFHVPVIFGKVRLDSKFPEAKISQDKGCAFSVEDLKSLRLTFENLQDEKVYEKAREGAESWLAENLGAARKICNTMDLILQDER
ncbi:3-deoxy-D-manno-octulosonic acid transferase [Algoriphagus sediminis]|uniref:3-deoxy-D-manno-octulosonic acid transferase n=1 Tax=Algoriphagus sediminis TaxID=3057113 RepID=A0ABT7YEY5_9BACT|nr:glycosyltransferase N-terminal domain-containing protein [Algoriphagus sediminis]MDN3205087.1 glycosyltransferase N-terminal domain-containing protein [Algoriphagus sediminis]